jgi:hypothetical protein
LEAARMLVRVGGVSSRLHLWLTAHVKVHLRYEHRAVKVRLAAQCVGQHACPHFFRTNSKHEAGKCIE